MAATTKPTSVTVMTRNLFLGSDLNPIVGGKTPGEVAALAARKWGEVLASDFPARAEAIAGEIARVKPMLIGLQEAMLFRSQAAADGPTTQAKKVDLDFVKILIAALRDRGLAYKPVVTAVGYDVEVAASFEDGTRDLRVTNREVVLARDDLEPSALQIHNPQRGQFEARLAPVALATGDRLSLPWAWASVDATVGKHTFRFVTTHLDSLSAPNRSAQAAELLAGPGATTLPTVFVGDFNSPPDGSGGSAYSDLMTSGLVDAWGVGQGTAPGLSCCQAEDIRNATSTFDRRIDLVLFRGAFGVDNIEQVGAQPSDRLRSGLWPSDHAGLVATLSFR